MSQLRTRYGKIERLVGSLLSENSITRPPVPVDKLVKKVGINLKHGDLGDVSGLLVRYAAGATIGVNDVHSKERQRFTIAHEFGHYLLHQGIAAHYDRNYRINLRSHVSSQATDVEEIEANFFAASLLMPRAFLDEDKAIDALDDDVGVAALAKRYNVSRHAMSLRLANVYGDHRPF